MEEWRAVKGFEQFYLVSNEGHVFSRRSGKILKPVLRNGNHGSRYLGVDLFGDTYRKSVYIHRLVAEAFVDKPDGCTCVNHIDENKQNNKASNLEWCTLAYNNTYNGKDQRICKSIVQIDPNTGEEKRWQSARKAQEAGIADYKNISACCRGLRKHAGGYMWRFEERNDGLSVSRF